MHLLSRDELIENFSFLDNWEDKYRYIIELANDLPASEEDLRQEHYLISGCVSQVWLKITPPKTKDGPFLFAVDTDSLMVKGLLAIILTFYQEKSASWILSNHPKDLFEKLNLHYNLSRQRANGLNALIEAIQNAAKKFLAESR